MRILCTREKQNSIRESVYLLLKDRAYAGNFPYQFTEREIRHPNGSRFYFAGLWNNTENLKSYEGVDVCWVEEAQSVSRSSLDILIPTIRKEGSEIWFSFNPKHPNDPVYQMFVASDPPEGSIVRKVSWRDNPWFTSKMKRDMRHLEEHDHDRYLHIWEGEFMQYADGAIYGNQMKAARDDGRICSLPVQTGRPVHTFWDLGRNDTTAIVCMQEDGGWFNFIDCYESRLVGLDHYVAWLKSRPYIYGDHYLPHDVEVSELSTNTSRKQTLEELGVRPIKVVDRIPYINEGIELTRQLLSKCRFDEDKCQPLLDALANYQYVYDEKYDTFRQTPLHNWASNFADAFRQFGQGFRKSGWDTLNFENMSERRAAKLRPQRQNTQWMV